MAVRERTILWQFIDTEDRPKTDLTVTVKLVKQEQTDLNQIVVVDPETATTDEHGQCQMSLIVTDDYIGRSLYAASWPGQPELLFYLPFGDGQPIQWTVLVHEESPVIPPGDLPRLVPPGGKTGEVLTKASDANYDDYWSAESGKGPPGPAGGFAYYASTPMGFDPVTAKTPAAQDWTVQLASKTFEGPILADIPFISFYEGFFYIDVSVKETYDIIFVVEHTIGDVSFTSQRLIEERFTAGAEFTIPMSVYNSVSVIEPGTFTDANGKVVRITEQMLTQPSTITLSLRVTVHNKTTEFSIDAARMESAGAYFWQQALGTVSLAKGDKGDKGDPGVRGSKWFNGNGAPGTIAGALAGDYYADDSGTGDVYAFNGTVWEKIFTLEGPKGDKGDTGAGVPDGGTTDQVLAKRSNTNQDTYWKDESGGGGTGFTPSKTNIYPPVKAILEHTGQEVVSVTGNDTDSEITFGIVAGSIIKAMLAARSVGSNQIEDAAVQGKHVANRTLPVSKIAASGTASDNTFLRGDGQWAVPSGADIEVDDEGAQVTAAARKLNFTGTGVTVTSDENGVVTITIGGSAPHPGTHDRYCGWSDSLTPTEAEISRGTVHEQDSFPVPQRAANGFVWFATPTSVGAVSAVYWGNNQQVNQIGGFTRTQRQIDSTNYYLYVTDAEQNAAIVGTGTFQIRLEY